MKEKIKNEINYLKENNDRNFSYILIFSCIILFLYCYFGSFSFFEKTFANIENIDFWKIIYHNFMSFLLFFVIGAMFVKFVLKEKLINFGITAGNYKLGLKLILIAIPIAFLCGLSCILDKDMTATYPLINFGIYGEFWQIFLYYLSYFLYYLGWEFLFRGILYFASEKKCGVMGAILISTLISALIHTSIGAFGKPMLETLSAIPAGLIFGYIASKTKSIWPTLIIHFLIGVSTDMCIFCFA